MSTHDDVLVAFSDVKNAVKRMHTELDSIRKEITSTEDEIKHLHALHPPFEDMKQGILDLVKEAGRRFESDTIRAKLIDFATGNMSGTRPRRYGDPLTLAELDGAINGSVVPENGAQLISFSRGDFDDRAFHAFCTELVLKTMARVMADMTPSDFGYDNLSPEEIGPTRDEMHERETILRAKLGELRAREKDMVLKLSQIGAIDVDMGAVFKSI